ncbi:MAG: hypothetical protein IJ094_04775 [Bacilli bacterium]|nr:hypothetical protein [Bacilli bacterium]
MKRNNENYKFTDSAILNDETFMDYINRFKRIALSIFEWVNLPKSMNARFIELCLYYTGQCAFLKDKTYGFINTKCCGSGYVNIYGLPTKLNCFSYNYQSTRTLYTGLNPNLSEKQFEYQKNNEAILVMNNYDRLPTSGAMELFAYRLYNAERTCDVNLNAQRTPLIIAVDEKQRLMMENLFNQYNGNQPFIFGDKSQLSEIPIKSISTEAPYVIDKITEYKKEIWNEALTFLGINNISVKKKERLTENEANENNELVNLNLFAMLEPRKQACREFNEKFGLTGTDKEISVRVRSDLYNIIKNEESLISDYQDNGRIDKVENINKIEEIKGDENE